MKGHHRPQQPTCQAVDGHHVVLASSRHVPAVWRPSAAVQPAVVALQQGQQASGLNGNISTTLSGQATAAVCTEKASGEQSPSCSPTPVHLEASHQAAAGQGVDPQHPILASHCYVQAIRRHSCRVHAACRASSKACGLALADMARHQACNTIGCKQSDQVWFQ